MKQYKFTTAFTLVCLLNPIVVSATEYTFAPRVSTKVVNNDNLLLNPNNEVEVTKITLIPEFKLKAKQETWESGFTALFKGNQFYGEDGLDSNDFYFTTENSYRLTEKVKLGLMGNYTRDTTLDSDIDLTGQVFNRLQRMNWGLTPNLEYQFTEKVSASASISYSDLSFDENLTGTGFSEYTIVTPTANVIYALTEKDQLTFALSQMDYESETTPDIIGTSQTLIEQQTVQLGWNHMFTQEDRLSIALGARDTTTTSKRFLGTAAASSTDTDGTGLTFNSSFAKTFETGTLTASFTRQSTPSSTAGLLDTSQLRLRYDHQYSMKLFATIDARYTEAETVTGTNTNISAVRDLKTYHIRPSLRWRITQEWQLLGAYRFTQQENRNGADADANVYELDLKYTWPVFSKSR